MSLFDHFTETAANKSRSSSVASSIIEEHITHQTSDTAAGSSRAAIPSFSAASNPIFSLDKVQFNFPGSIVDLQVENNILAVACALQASGKGMVAWWCSCGVDGMGWHIIIFMLWNIHLTTILFPTLAPCFQEFFSGLISTSQTLSSVCE